MRRLSILGSTGSIGKQTLEVCRKAPADFTVEGLSCGSDINTLYEQIKEFSPKAAAVRDEAKGKELAKRLKDEGIKTEVYTGQNANSVIAELPESDTVVGAIVGLLVAIVQAATQIQDQTLAFVVKLVSVLAALAIFLPWCMSRLAEFTARLIENAPETLSGVL